MLPTGVLGWERGGEAHSVDSFRAARGIYICTLYLACRALWHVFILRRAGFWKSYCCGIARVLAEVLPLVHAAVCGTYFFFFFFGPINCCTYVRSVDRSLGRSGDRSVCRSVGRGLFLFH